MNHTNFSTSFLVDQSPEEVYHAINQVRDWWSENIQGSTEGLHSEFFYHYKDVHLCKLRIEESTPGKKVSWLVLENHFNFTKQQNEWKDTHIVFEISKEGESTKLQFTHLGLTSDYECFDVCRDAWTSYIQGSLKALIITGKGKPNTKENDLNHELIQKWGLPKK